MKKQKYAIMVSALVALILAVASGPAHATTLLTETFTTDSSTPATVGYTQYSWSVPSPSTAVVGSGQLQMSTTGQTSTMYAPSIDNIVLGAFSQIQVDLAMNTGAAQNDGLGIQLTSTADSANAFSLFVFPGSAIIQLYKPTAPNFSYQGDNSVTFPKATGDNAAVYQHLSLTSDGDGNFTVDVFNVGGGQSGTSHSTFSEPLVKAFSVGLVFDGFSATANMTGTFDNWQIDEVIPVPEPSVLMLLPLGGFLMFWRRSNKQSTREGKKSVMNVKPYAVIASALVAVLVASSAQASALDSTTQGNWIGTYGANGYILNDYNGGGLGAGDIVSKPAYLTGLTGYSYPTGAATYQPYVGGALSGGSWPYPHDLQNPTISPIPIVGSLQDVRNEGIVYNVGGNVAIALTVDPLAKPFQLALYSQYTFTDTTWNDTIQLAWGAGSPFETQALTHFQVQDGIWTLFNVVPNGQTVLNITLIPGAPVLNVNYDPAHPEFGPEFFNQNASVSGIMFDGGGLFIPEPSTVMLLGMGGFIVWLRRRNR